MKLKSIILIGLCACSSLSHADNIIRTPAAIRLSTDQASTPTAPNENWISSDPIYSSWANAGEKACSMTPESNTLKSDFTQSVECTQAQTRSVQAREQNEVTGEYRNFGEPAIENQSVVSPTTYRSGTCRLSYQSPSSWWESHGDGISSLAWEDNFLPVSYGTKGVEITVNGVTYLKGAPLDEPFSWICRVQ